MRKIIAAMGAIVVCILIGVGIDVSPANARVEMYPRTTVDEGEPCGPDGIALSSRPNSDGFPMLCWDRGDGVNRWHVMPESIIPGEAYLV